MNDFLSSAGSLITLMIVFALVEVVVPLKLTHQSMKSRIGSNLGLMVITLLLGFFLNLVIGFSIIQVQVHELAILSLQQLSFVPLLFTSILILDFFAYLAHRSMHASPWLWRVHKVHHSDLFVDVTTSYRQHPLEGFWRALFVIIPCWLFGIPLLMIVLYRLFSASFAIFEHANIDLGSRTDKLLSNVFITPNLHKIHHSREQIETDSNYGNIFSLHDRLGGTLNNFKTAKTVVYGLDGYNGVKEQSLKELVALPFIKN